MRGIREALKPGGVMVCEEAGVSGIYAEPRSQAYEEMQSGERNKGPIPRHLIRDYTGPPPRDVPKK